MKVAYHDACHLAHAQGIRSLPRAVASANPGCSLQIAAHSERLGRRLPVLHPMELLRMSIEGS